MYYNAVAQRSAALMRYAQSRNWVERQEVERKAALPAGVSRERYEEVKHDPWRDL
jgi:hypothetical protein